MTFNKRLLAAIFLIPLICLACTTQPDVPLVLSKEIPTSTTTTIKPSVVITKQTPATTPTATSSQQKPILPSILEPELRNLYSEVYSSYKELVSYEINSLFPVPFSEIAEQFEKVRMNYEIQIWRWPYSGEASYPFYVELKILSKQISSLVEKGLFTRSEAERTRALAAADAAKTGKIASKTPDRIANADAALASGNTFHTGVKYRSSISFYKKAIILYASATAKAEAEKAKARLADSGLARFSPYLKIEADRLLTEESSLFALSDSDSISQGITLLGRATQLYNYSVDWGIECQASEAKDRALIAQRFATGDFAEVNAPDTFEKATALFNEAEAKFQLGDFIQATTKFKDATSSFETAQAVARLSAGNAKIAHEIATVRLDYLKTKIGASGFGEDPNFRAAKTYLAQADEKLLSSLFELSRIDSLEAINQITISDNNLEAKLSARRTAAQAEADKLAAEQRSIVANKQAEIDILSKEKAKVEEKLAEVEKQLSKMLQTSSVPPSKETGPKVVQDQDSLSKNLLARIAEMETTIKRLESEQAKLEREVSDARTEAARLAAKPAVTEEVKAIPVVPVPQQPSPQKPPAVQNPPERQEVVPPAKEISTSSVELAKSKARADIDLARKKLEWARTRNAENNYPATLSRGVSELEAATRAFKSEDFAGSSEKAGLALTTFSGIPEFAELPQYYHVGALPQINGIDSLSRIAGYAFVYGDVLKWPLLYNANKNNLPDPSNPNLIRWNQPILIPSIRGETRSGTWDPRKTYKPLEKYQPPEVSTTTQKQVPTATVEKKEAKKAEILSALADSQKAYEEAVRKNAKNNYPSILEKGANELTLAKTCLEASDYENALSQAKLAQKTLLAIKEFAPLPARYKVRRIPDATDSLWRIAGYPFVYGDSYKWKKLFEANRNMHENFTNPDLIQAGDIITIPSLAGEYREGLWDPQKTYPPLSNPVRP